jgi:hypothetical protein
MSVGPPVLSLNESALNSGSIKLIQRARIPQMTVVMVTVRNGKSETVQLLPNGVSRKEARGEN